jgi:hypothetical protein
VRPGQDPYFKLTEAHDESFDFHKFLAASATAGSKWLLVTLL